MKAEKNIDFRYNPSIIFAKDENWSYGREPVLRRMPDGSLVCLIYSGGTREPHGNNVALITRSRDDGTSWSKPEVMFSHDSRAVWPTEIFTEGDRVFAIIHTFEVGGWYTELQAYITYTDDSGKTWSEPVSVKGFPNNIAVRQGKVLSNGNWLFPVYWQEEEGSWNWKSEGKFFRGVVDKWFFRSGVIISSDKGKTFTLYGYLKNDFNIWEPEFIELEAGHLLMYLRSDGTGVLWKSESFDYGTTWSSAVATDIPNPGTKFVMLKVNNKIVLINNTDKLGSRSCLELWTSGDNCKSWDKKIILAKYLSSHQKLNINKEFHKLPWICYPHAFVDKNQETIYIACDSVNKHYLLRVPFEDFI